METLYNAIKDNDSKSIFGILGVDYTQLNNGNLKIKSYKHKI